ILHGRDNTTNPYRFFSVIVASVPGVLLIPDNDMFAAAQNPPAHYTAAWNIITSLLSPNTFNGTFRSNVISLDNFYELEKAGCAFLPCVFHNQDAITSTEDIGYYWTSQVSGYGGGVEMNLNQESSGVKSNLSPYYNPGVIRLARDFGTR
ncbi:MAG: hypothetical protein J6W95_00005, partial [Bacteroidales bacterium]|nr:hypothetical protein [Bacteroidales bacterium]